MNTYDFGEKGFDKWSLFELKRLYKYDANKFIEYIKDYINYLFSYDDYEGFMKLYESLKTEIKDISPFLSREFGIIFLNMIEKKELDKVLANYELIEACGNYKLYEALKKLSTKGETNRKLETKDIILLNRLVLALDKKHNSEKDISHKVELKIEDADLEWRESI